MNPRKILITCGGGLQGMTLQKMFSTLPDVEIHLLDIHVENIGRYFAHRHHLAVPLKNEAQYVDQICAICRAEGIGLIVPATALDLGVLAKNKPLFESHGLKCAVSEHGFLEKLLSKRAAYLWLEERGLPVLPILDWAQIHKNLPAIGKPENTWGGRGIVFLKEGRDLITARQAVGEEVLGSLVWQRLLDNFKEFSMDIAIGFDKKASPVTIRQRLHISGGFATVFALQNTECLSEIGNRVAQSFAEEGGCGFFNVQVLFEPKTGDYFISDINPRIGTSAVGFMAFEGPDLLAKSLLDGVSGTGRDWPSQKGATTRIIRFLDEKKIRPLDQEFDICGIVFDLDDTLISTKHWIKNKLVGFHAAFGTLLPPLPIFLEQALFRLEEGHRADLVDIIVADFGLNTSSRIDFINAYRAVVPENFPLKKDARFVVEHLGKRFKLAILTDNPRVSQEQKIASTGIAPYFDAIVFSADIGENKPSARCFEAVSAAIGIAPTHLLMVGDNLVRDIRGAKDAGFAHSLWIRQPGSMFNFDPQLFPNLVGSYTPIGSLLDIVHLFSAKN